MSGPFRENIRNLVEKVDGGVAAVLMGFDGISVDSFARPGHDGALPDIQTLAMEFAHLIAQARRTLQSLNAGALEEFTWDENFEPRIGGTFDPTGTGKAKLFANWGRFYAKIRSVPGDSRRGCLGGTSPTQRF